MKKRLNLKNALVLILIALYCIPFVSCKKDYNNETPNSNTPFNPSSPITPDPTNPSIYVDPENAIIANLRNDGGYITLLGTTLKINTANNFIGGDVNYTMSFVGVGEVSGLGYVCTIPQSGWSDQVAVIPGNGYVAKCVYDNRTSYARIYVIQYILSANLEILGAEIKYQDYWEPFPVVSTKEITNVTSTSATCGGVVTSDGGFPVTERGVCWSTSAYPTVNDSHVSSGAGLGEYSVQITDLIPNTKYYVRAYARNSVGTSYGEEKYIIQVPEGAVVGIFSINEHERVFFSQGNLQYRASTDTWRFAESQWDTIGEANVNISPTYDGWIDLFGWGTGNNPTNSSLNNSSYSVFNDWGNNAFVNGSNVGNTWRTMTRDEWTYVIHERNTPSGIRYALATVHGVEGTILLPDNWSASTFELNNTNSSGVDSNGSFNNNIINESEWRVLESAGAVFLPVNGLRQETSMVYLTDFGYWTSTSGYVNEPYCVHFTMGGLSANCPTACYYGCGVRLVRNVE